MKSAATRSGTAKGRDKSRRRFDAERFIERIGFAACLTDSRRPGPSLYVAVCGRRDAVMPRNVQTDPETSLTWELKDEILRRGKVYYGKLSRGKAMFIAPRLVPAFHAVWGMRQGEERHRLSRNARAILAVLRKEWEMSSIDLRTDSGVKDRASLHKGLGRIAGRDDRDPQRRGLSTEVHIHLDAGGRTISGRVDTAPQTRRGLAGNRPGLSRWRGHDSAR